MKLSTILASIVSVGVIAGGVYTLDATYARERRHSETFRDRFLLRWPFI
jgi:hypothetical protein